MKKRNLLMVGKNAPLDMPDFFKYEIDHRIYSR
jgi:hypothetical protein